MNGKDDKSIDDQKYQRDDNRVNIEELERQIRGI
jgi:hypothetical protein